MRQANGPLTWSSAVSVSMGSSSASDPIFLDQECLVSVQAVWSGGAPVGNFTIETSCDAGNQNISPATGLSHWNTYTGSTQAAGGAAGSFTWRIAYIPDRWIRLVYTRSSDTGTLTARFQLKG